MSSSRSVRSLRSRSAASSSASAAASQSPLVAAVYDSSFEMKSHLQSKCDKKKKDYAWKWFADHLSAKSSSPWTRFRPKEKYCESDGFIPFQYRLTSQSKNKNSTSASETIKLVQAIGTRGVHYAIGWVELFDLLLKYGTVATREPVPGRPPALLNYQGPPLDVPPSFTYININHHHYHHHGGKENAIPNKASARRTTLPALATAPNHNQQQCTNLPVPSIPNSTTFGKIDVNMRQQHATTNCKKQQYHSRPAAAARRTSIQNTLGIPRNDFPLVAAKIQAKAVNEHKQKKRRKLIARNLPTLPHSSSNSSSSRGVDALATFTIPRKKNTSGSLHARAIPALDASRSKEHPNRLMAIPKPTPSKSDSVWYPTPPGLLIEHEVYSPVVKPPVTFTQYPLASPDSESESAASAARREELWVEELNRSLEMGSRDGYYKYN